MGRKDAAITIAGAGAIGLYVGGRLAAAGRRVCFLARPRIVRALWRNGLTVSDTAGFEQILEPGDFEATADLDAALSAAELILVTVKSKDTADMAGEIAARARKARTVVSLQNGVRNAGRLSLANPETDVRAGMVPFNVVIGEETGLQAWRTSQGPIMIDADREDPLVALLGVEGLPVEPRGDMDTVLFSKLLINLNNAINALSGLPIAAQLADWRWRAIMGACVAEAIEIARVSGQPIKRIGPINPVLTPALLSLPNWLFKPVMRRMNQIDPRAISSMHQDLIRKRETEIDDLQGEIARRAEAVGRPAPINAGIAALVAQAEALAIGPPDYAPETVARRCGLQL